MGIDKTIKDRKSVRKFSSKKPDWREIIEAIDYARYAPMAGNLFSLKFILVKNPRQIEKISEECQQEFIKDVHYLVVFCSDTSRTLTAYEEKGQAYLRQQSGAAIQNFLLKLTETDLSTCWIGYFIEEQIKKILKIPEKVDVEAIFPIGYEKKHHSEKRSRKIQLDEAMYFEEYGNKKMQD